VSAAQIRFVLHRPRNSQNIGAAARALANTSAGALWVVEPEGYDRAQAARLAAGADEVLESMQVAHSLDEALADCVDVVMTTGKPPEDLPPPLEPEAVALRLLTARGPVALVFGDEVRGLTNKELRRAGAIATIPTAAKASLNLAQALLVFAYEVLLARRAHERAEAVRAKVRVPDAIIGGPTSQPGPLEDLSSAAPQGEPAARADERLIGLLRGRAQALLLRAGFLNPQQPDRVLDELLRMLRRAEPSRREIELLLAACDQLARTVPR
jgi:tRNA/rRNA methyltransferase/tRNA (cytidine32/uridine32-2'-O)-methyltransferase